jgi:hypothetical protein
VPSRDLVGQRCSGTVEASDLDRLVLNVDPELSDKLGSQLRIVDRVDRPDGFFNMPAS